MKKLHPLHVGAVLVCLLLFFVFKLSGAKDELLLAKEEYKESALALNELSSLNSAYLGKEEVKKSLQRILAQPLLKGANIEQKLKSNSIVLTAATLEKEALNSIMSKLLNGAYDIAAVNIKKLSDNKASLEVEIQW